jgi:hypothetical protein
VSTATVFINIENAKRTKPFHHGSAVGILGGAVMVLLCHHPISRRLYDNNDDDTVGVSQSHRNNRSSPGHNDAADTIRINHSVESIPFPSVQSDKDSLVRLRCRDSLRQSA